MSLYQAFYGLVALTCLLWVLVLRSGFDRREIRLAIGGVLCVIALWMWEISEPMILFSDFTTAYYPAGRAIRDDLPHLYRRCWDTPVCGFVNLPIVALLFTPFSFFTLRHAQWLFAAFSLVSVGMSLYLLWSVSKRDPRRKWAMLLLFASRTRLPWNFKINMPEIVISNAVEANAITLTFHPTAIGFQSYSPASLCNRRRTPCSDWTLNALSPLSEKGSSAL